MNRYLESGCKVAQETHVGSHRGWVPQARPREITKKIRCQVWYEAFSEGALTPRTISDPTPNPLLPQLCARGIFIAQIASMTHKKSRTVSGPAYRRRESFPEG